MATEPEEQVDDEQPEGEEPESPAEGGGEPAPSTPEPANDNGKQAESRANRKERRAAWLRERQLEAADLRRTLESERAQRERLAVEVAEMRGRLASQPQPDPIEDRLGELRKKAAAHLKASAGAKDQETAQRELDAYHAALEDIADTRAQRQVMQAREEFARSQPDPQQMRVAGRLESEFPWVSENPSARAVADAFINEMLGQGHADGYQTYRAACARAAQVLNLGGTPTRGNNGNQRYSLPTGRAGGSGGGGESLGKLDAHQERMAELRYPELDAEKAHAKWAAREGRAALAAMNEK